MTFDLKRPILRIINGSNLILMYMKTTIIILIVLAVVIFGAYFIFFNNNSYQNTPTPAATTPETIVPAPAATPATTVVPAPAPTTPAPKTPTASNVSISIKNFAFSPSTITVKVGTKVTWTNNDSVAHTTGIYNAGIGYDLCTGLGSLNGKNLYTGLISAIKSH